MISSQVILYEMLVGQPPFLANTPAETQYKVGVILLDFVDDVIFILFTFSCIILITFSWDCWCHYNELMMSYSLFRWSTGTSLCRFLASRDFLRRLATSSSLFAQGLFKYIYKYFLCHHFDFICSDDRRIGKNGSDDIKSHPFFANIDFSSALRTKQAPYKPTIK